MEFGCFIALLAIEFFVIQINDKLFDIKEILKDIRESKENTNNRRDSTSSSNRAEQ